MLNGYHYKVKIMDFRPESSQCKKCAYGKDECYRFKHNEDILRVLQKSKISEPVLFSNCMEFQSEILNEYQKNDK